MQKNSNWLIAGILFVGAVIGILFVAVFTSVIHWAGTNEFCGTFCHDMTRVYAAYHRGSHGRSPSGMTAGCSDCHLKYHSNEHIGPVDYSLMLVDKCISASSSAWGWVRGTMNTDEKQITIAPELSKKVHEHMIKQDFSTLIAISRMLPRLPRLLQDVRSQEAVRRPDPQEHDPGQEGRLPRLPPECRSRLPAGQVMAL